MKKRDQCEVRLLKSGYQISRYLTNDPFKVAVAFYGRYALSGCVPGGSKRKLLSSLRDDMGQTGYLKAP